MARNTAMQKRVNSATGVNNTAGIQRSTRNSQMRGTAARLRGETGQRWTAYTRYGYVGVAGSGSIV